MNILRSLLIFTILILPAGFALAQFQPLVGIPGITDRDDAPGIGDYVNAIYRLAISIAALLAVLMIIYGGVQYMFSDIVSTKQAAKSTIRGALLGLLLIISAVLILSTINTNLTNFEIEIAQFEVRDLSPTPGGGSASASCRTTNTCQVIQTPFSAIGARERCDALEGEYLETATNRTCITDTNRVDQVLEAAAVENCPEGATCSMQLCEGYTGESTPSAQTCRERCELDLAGGYNSQLRACAIPGTVTDESITCSDTTNDADNCSTSGICTNANRCAAGIQSCRARGGIPIEQSSGDPICRIIETEVPDNVRDQVCTGGEEYNCEVATCPTRNSWIPWSCSRWCRSEFSPFANYNSTLNVCYTERRIDSPSNPTTPITNDNTGNDTASSCDGYFEPSTRVCYSNTIELSSEFANERNDIRQMECQSVGGTYNFEDRLCYRR